ncbi:DUF4012 domain-containing protein [Patescibacteria group bacterium]
MRKRRDRFSKKPQTSDSSNLPKQEPPPTVPLYEGGFISIGKKAESVRLRMQLAYVERRQKSLRKRQQYFQSRAEEAVRSFDDLKKSLKHFSIQKKRIRENYLELLSLVESYRKKQAAAQKTIATSLRRKNRELEEKDKTLARSQIRLLNVQIGLWGNYRTWYLQASQIRMGREKRATQELKLLQAQLHKVRSQLKKVEREQEKNEIRLRRRGRIIAGSDLNNIAGNLASFASSKVQTSDQHKTLLKEYQVATHQARIEIQEAAEQIAGLKQEEASALQEVQGLQNQQALLTQETNKQKLKIEQSSYIYKAKSLFFGQPNNSSQNGLMRPSVAVFVVMALVLTSSIGVAGYVNRGLTVKSDVLGESQNAYNHIIRAEEAFSSPDYGTAKQELIGASNSFFDAYKETLSLGNRVINVSGLIPKASQLKSGKELLQAGQRISLAGVHITNGLEKIGTVESFSGDTEYFDGIAPAGSENGKTLTDALASSQNDFKEAEELLIKAAVNLEQVKSQDVPEDIRSEIAMLKDTFPQAVSAYSHGVSVTGALLHVLGSESQKRYLLLFQNNTELRGTGGFIGSYGVLDIDDGRVEQIKIDGIYNPDGQLLEKVFPPYPLRMIAPKWFMRDANWYPDFPTAAERTADFYEKSGGPSVDGVISFTPTIIERLLEVTGPIKVPDYDVTVTADNFLSTTQYKVEIDYDKKLNRPKKFLADLLPQILSEILSMEKERWFDVLMLLNDSLAEKQMLVYFKNAEAEQVMKDSGFGGEIKEAPQDYLSVINSNILGYKTDTLIDEKIDQTVTIHDDGEIISELHVTRTHNGHYAWPSGENRSYIRVYVPKGAELLDASGFEYLEETDRLYPCDECETDPYVSRVESSIQRFANNNIETFEELDKTVFGGWQLLPPQSTKEYKLRYRLPFELDMNILNPADTYSLYVQKQSGSLGSDYSLDIHVPSGYDYAKIHPMGDQELIGIKRDQILRFETNLKKDRFMATVIEK